MKTNQQSNGSQKNNHKTETDLQPDKFIQEVNVKSKIMQTKTNFCCDEILEYDDVMKNHTMSLQQPRKHFTDFEQSDNFEAESPNYKDVRKRKGKRKRKNVLIFIFCFSLGPS